MGWADKTSTELVRTALSYLGVQLNLLHSPNWWLLLKSKLPQTRLLSDALIHESTKLLIPKSMLSPKVGRIKGDTSYDIIMERWTTLQGREWGLNFPARGDVVVKEVWDQKQHFFPFPRAPPEHTCQFSAVRVTTERCWPQVGRGQGWCQPPKAQGRALQQRVIWLNIPAVLRVRSPAIDSCNQLRAQKLRLLGNNLVLTLSCHDLQVGSFSLWDLCQSSYLNTCQSGLDWWEGGSAEPERWASPWSRINRTQLQTNRTQLH